jgi:hypothetical protein
MFDESALCISIPVIIKARQEGDRRLVEVEASNEHVDSEGDVITQNALLGAADGFVKGGHLDIDHMSEIGERLGIQRPADYIVGVPTGVKDLGDGRTGVTGELHKSGRYKADELWESLRAEPPVRWQASIYGFPLPGKMVDARVTKSGNLKGATRFYVDGLDWRSLAFTRNPINTSITGAASIVTAKAFAAVMKSRMPSLMADTSKSDYFPQAMPAEASSYILSPRNRLELLGHYNYHIQNGRCPVSSGSKSSSVGSFAEHFMMCCCDSPDEADIKALALMHLLKREKRS